MDDGTYRVLDVNRLVVFKEFPKVTFRYRISGRTMALEPVIGRGAVHDLPVRVERRRGVSGQDLATRRLAAIPFSAVAGRGCRLAAAPPQ